MYSLDLMPPKPATYSELKENNKQLSNTADCLNLALADPGGRAAWRHMPSATQKALKP